MRGNWLAVLLVLSSWICIIVHCEVVNVEDIGAVSTDAKDKCKDVSIAERNRDIFSSSLQKLEEGDTWLVPNKTFCLMGNVTASGLRNVKLQIDGTIRFSNNQKAWPRDENGNVKECFYFEDIEHVSFTSSGTGTIDGQGKGWWGYIEYLLIQENRPRLLHIENSADLLVENLLLKDSPYWTFLAGDVERLEIRNSAIDARRDKADYHDLEDLGAFNTDGFDVAGRDIWIHDVDIWNDDDSICVKERSGGSGRTNCSENMLFENVRASGVGLTVGSIGPSSTHTCVRNITFRNAYMHHTFKGIYMKSRPGAPDATGEITDVLYENIVMDGPTQWAIWIGPQQASYSGACSLLWPWLGANSHLAGCPVPSQITWDNIVLRNITINSPKHSPGVLLGNSTNPISNLVFDGVVVSNPGKMPWGDKFYDCQAVQGTATGGTWPVPPCFNEVEN